jgi:hypothetical protein
MRNIGISRASKKMKNHKISKTLKVRSKRTSIDRNKKTNILLIIFCSQHAKRQTAKRKVVKTIKDKPILSTPKEGKSTSSNFTRY